MTRTSLRPLLTPTGRVQSEHRNRRSDRKVAGPGERGCEVDGCADKHYSRGWCSRHYFRWYRYGSVSGATRTPEMEMDRILDLLNERAPLDESTGCWLWQGAVSRGNPVLQVAGVDGPIRLEAHRLSYLLLVGPIPDGTRFGRRCGHKECINPQHLREIRRIDDPWAARLANVGRSTWDIVMEYLPFARQTVRVAVYVHYPRFHREMDEWEQYGLLGLIEAASRKPDLPEHEFRKYARRCIKTAMAQGLREMLGQPRHDLKGGIAPTSVSLDALLDAGWEVAA